MISGVKTSPILDFLEPNIKYSKLAFQQDQERLHPISFGPPFCSYKKVSLCCTLGEGSWACSLELGAGPIGWRGRPIGLGAKWPLGPLDGLGSDGTDRLAQGTIGPRLEMGLQASLLLAGVVVLRVGLGPLDN
jgi:hypothetical protein